MMDDEIVSKFTKASLKIARVIDRLTAETTGGPDNMDTKNVKNIITDGKKYILEFLEMIKKFEDDSILLCHEDKGFLEEIKKNQLINLEICEGIEKLILYLHKGKI